MAEVGAIVRDGGRPGDVSTGFDFLHLLAFRQRDDMENGVASTECGFAFEDRWRAIDIVAGFVNPVRFARRRIHAVQLKIVAADEHPVRIALWRFHPVRRAEDLVAGLIFPKLLATRGLDRIQRSVRRTEKHFAVEHQRR